MSIAGRRAPTDDFTKLVRSYDDRLRALAFRMLGDPHRMDDALQDAYAKAFRSFGRFRNDSDPGTWLYRIVYNACIDLLRRDGRYTETTLDDVDVVSDSAIEVDSSDRLESSLALLSPDHRAVVLLVDAVGFDYAEAGEILGVPVGTVASRLSRAHALLRDLLKEQSS